MPNPAYDSRGADKFVVRFPDSIRPMVEQEAIMSGRSMNAVLVEATKEYLNGRQRKAALLGALEAAVKAAEGAGDARDLFIKANPTGCSADELVKNRDGFVDDRTHADYLVFLAGYRARQGGAV